MVAIVSESKAFSRWYLIDGQNGSEWGTGLQEKIRLLSAVQGFLKELIYFKGIRP